MKPTVEELIVAQKVLDDARDRVRAIVNEYTMKNRITVYMSVYDGKARVLLAVAGAARIWPDNRGVRCMNQTYVDYDEAKIRDKLIEAEKVFEERGR